MATVWTRQFNSMVVTLDAAGNVLQVNVEATRIADSDVATDEMTTRQREAYAFPYLSAPPQAVDLTPTEQAAVDSFKALMMTRVNTDYPVPVS